MEYITFALGVLYYGFGIILKVLEAIKMRKESTKEKDLLKQVSSKKLI